MNRNRRAPTLILVLGGAASGKSQAALDLAGPVGPKAFVAMGQARDSEMAQRIRRHRAARTSDWDTAEIPLGLAGNSSLRYNLIGRRASFSHP